MNFNILADENIPWVDYFFGANAHVERLSGRAISSARLHNIDILLVRSVTQVNAALLSGSAVKFVGTATSGFDHIDQAYLQQHGIDFAYAPGSNANSVVEYVLAAIAGIGDTLETLLAGGTVGIVGYGNVGKALAGRCEALGISYRVYDPWLDQNSIDYAVNLDAILDCDVVTLHPELRTDSPWPSYHLLGIDELERLRPDSLLINASRGAVIDNAALLSQLKSGQRVASVLDVWEGEPSINAELLEHVTLGTAHIAGYSLDGKILATRMLADAVSASYHIDSAVLNSPVGDPPALRLAEILSSAEQIRYLIQSRYDIAMDDTFLRQAVLGEKDARNHAKRFDQLRKSYRARRELAGSIVSGSVQTSANTDMVRALACIPAASGVAE